MTDPLCLTSSNQLPKGRESTLEIPPTLANSEPAAMAVRALEAERAFIQATRAEEPAERHPILRRLKNLWIWNKLMEVN